jgi:HTH-type transcriptional regulator/antitoxin HigA
MTKAGMQIHPIRTEQDHRAAVARIEVLMNAAPDSPDGDELDVLATLVDAYEAKQMAYPTDVFCPLCRAKPHSPCVHPSGYIRKSPHDVRCYKAAGIKGDPFKRERQELAAHNEAATCQEIAERGY